MYALLQKKGVRSWEECLRWSIIDRHRAIAARTYKNDNGSGLAEKHLLALLIHGIENSP